MAQPLIGMIGKKRSGKDSVASTLVAEFGYSRVAFADPLREALLRLDPIIGRPALPDAPAPVHDVRLSEVIAAIGWERAKDYVPEVRVLLQRFGTDAIRAIDDDFWVRTTRQQIEALRADGPVVVTDVRFPNEADAIREAGGYLVRVTRPGTESEPGAHASETALDDYPEDIVVPNIGTLDCLAQQARYVGGFVAI